MTLGESFFIIFVRSFPTRPVAFSAVKRKRHDFNVPHKFKDKNDFEQIFLTVSKLKQSAY